MKFTREFYIPTEGEKHTDSRTPAVVYYYGELSAMGFGGKRSKPDFHYKFHSAERRDKFCQDYFDGQAEWAEHQASRKAEAKAYEHDYEVGDILCHSWGYGQTNIDFYQVVRVVSTKSIALRAICRKIVPGEGISSMSGYATPIPDSFMAKSKPMTKRVRVNGYVTIQHGSARRWDGKPEYCSWYH